MNKVYIVGNPNCGKTTLFNSLTKSSEHVGNWHGVTVDKVSKIIKFDNAEYEIIDLPGIYSLNAFSLEEQVAIDEILNNDCKILYLVDINNFKRSMLLALKLLINNKNIKMLVNNHKKFEKDVERLDIEYLKKILGCEIEIINAKNLKPSKQLFQFNTKPTAFISMLKNQLKDKSVNLNTNNTPNEIKYNGDYKCPNCKNNCLSKDAEYNARLNEVNLLYKYILKISDNCFKTCSDIYGYSRLDKFILKPYVFLPVFLLVMFAIIYFTFFLLGPLISDMFLGCLNLVVQKPIMAILKAATRSRFLIALFEEGVFGACFSVLGFLPQIVLMFVFLSVLENSGLISRMAFVMDDVLRKVGLNGKMVYTMLMGFGCSTTATITTKNMPDKNAKIKASLLTPFMSCSAKLPIYVMLGGALFGLKNIWVILGLYLLGIVVAIILAVIMERTILPSSDNQFILEFPPLMFPRVSNIYQSAKNASAKFVIKVFGIIFSFSIVLWILNNINIKFEYVGAGKQSILYSFSSVIAWAFKPIGLNNPHVVCALIIGLVAKELILSSFAISNQISNLSLLGFSLISANSVVNFNVATGISFLIFTLLYFPCVSNLGILIKEVGAKYTLFGLGLQLALAYIISYIAYSAITKNISHLLVVILMMFIILICIRFMYKKIKNKKIYCNCINCNKNK